MNKGKLALRDLFAVVTIVALALGWFVDHRRLSSNLLQTHQQGDRYRNDLEFLLLKLDSIVPGFRQNPHFGIWELETWKMERTVEDPLDPLGPAPTVELELVP